MTSLRAESPFARAGLRWVLALLACATAATIAPHSASARAPAPLISGVTNPGSNEQVAFDRTKAAGAAFVRIPLDWPHTAPVAQPSSWNPGDPADPNYHWQDTDLAVARAVQAGLVPVLQVDGVPQWAQRCQTPPVLPDAVCDPDPAALTSFASAAAQRYSGKFLNLPRVRYWQGLNEPNLSLFFFPQYDTEGHVLSAGLYRALIDSFYGAVKAVDPSNLVLAAGLGPIAVKSWTVGPMSFARTLLCMTGGNKNPRPIKGDCGGGVDFDIFAIQPYTTGGPTHEGGVNDVELGDLQKLQTLLAAADRAGRINSQFKHTPLWITEFSWDSQPPDPGGLPMDILTHWTSEALYTAWSAGVSHFFWYSLRDGLHQPGQNYSDTLESGLYFRSADVEQDQPKEVLYAFRFPFVAFPKSKGLFFWGRTPQSTAGKVAIQVYTGGKWRNVATVRASKAGMFSGMAPSRYGKNKKGYARALYRGQNSLAFSMKPIPDFRHAPFG